MLQFCSERALLRAAASALAVTFTVACSTPQSNAAVRTADASDTPAVNAAAGHAHTAENATIVVYKSPTCGCCAKWVDHLKENGFQVETRDMMDVAPIKTDLGVPRHLESCHTGVVNGYAVEGHVPADVIVRLLRERPKVAGIAVPGMPMGSPGMEGPRSEPYDIVAFKADGDTKVYESRR